LKLYLQVKIELVILAFILCILANQSQRLPSLKLHLSLAFALNQPKFASRMLRSNHDLPEEVNILFSK
jgi:hypothetical protein